MKRADDQFTSRRKHLNPNKSTICPEYSHFLGLSMRNVHDAVDPATVDGKIFNLSDRRKCVGVVAGDNL